MHDGVLIAGMHRSGTSAMSRVLNLLGCALPDDLNGPNLGNDRGHWESMSVVGLNDQILESAGSSWDDWTAINPDWRASPLRDEAVRKAKAIIRQHTDLGPLFLIKDPRICKLADIWLEALDAVGVRPTLVIMLRNPAEVAASLEARDLMSPAYGHLLWLRHMLEVEFYSRDYKRVVCQFGDLLNNWSGTVDQVKSRTALFFPRNSASTQDKIDLFIDKHGRHHSLSQDLVLNSVGVSAWLKRVYTIFIQWSAEGENVDDRLELDAIRYAFDQSAPAFSRLILPGTQSEIAGNGARLKLHLEEQLCKAQLAIQQADQMTAESQSRLLAADAREHTLVLQIEERSNAAAKLETEVSMLLEEAAHNHTLSSAIEDREFVEGQLRQEISELQRAMEAARQGEYIEESLSTETGRQLEQSQSALEHMQKRLAAADDRIISLSAEIGDRSHVNTTLELDIAELRNEVVRVTNLGSSVNETELIAQIAELERVILNNTQDYDLERDERVQAGHQLTATQEELSQISAQLSDANCRLALAESTLEQRKEELSQVWKELETAQESIADFEALRAEIKKLDEKLINSNDWVFRLAGERQAAQQATRRAEHQLKILQQNSDRHAEAANIREKTAQHKLVKATAHVARLDQLLLVQLELNATRLNTDTNQKTEDRLTELLRQRDEEVGAAEAAKGVAEGRLSARFNEIATLTKLLASASTETDASKMRAQWLRRLAVVTSGFPRWWSFMPAGWRRKREHARYVRKSLFNAEKYLRLYPDVMESGMDPIRHYILHGIDENRRNPI